MSLLSRRTVLRHLATGLGVGAFGLAACARRDLTPLDAALLRLAAEREAAAAVGQVYVADHPDEPRAALLQHLAVDLDWRDGLTDPELAQRLLRRIETDFRDAQTSRLDSWILSQTEARWAALVALA
jgi:hypothetical protein